ncbi:MAG: DUF2380 domain-containing protein [Methylococcales bacterium]|nr:DUF2380 domain-containing protein [Methylococcales bacterium]
MKKLLTIVALCFISMLFSGSVFAEVRIALLDFELKDVTLLPNRPEEIERTASIKPLLTAELQKAGFIILPVESTAQQAANMGEGYLFDHADVAAQLGKKIGADYVIVGRLHKPSFLFAYLLTEIVDVKSGGLIDSLSVETKGGEKKLTAKAVEMLADKITAVLKSK